MSQTLPKLSHRLVDEAQYNLLRSVGYLSRDDRRDIIDACEFGDIAHIKDKRKSGEPYITHPIAVAEILAGFRLDRDTIIAAILHDTVEDTEVTGEQIEQRYGKVVARLVDGVTKLKSSKYNKQQNKAATFHKILTATLLDPRVLIIKLSDRLHNMSTLDAVSTEKQRATAQETLDFYVPFARLMGINDIADYIEVLCYRNLNSEMYNKLSDKLLQHGLGRNFQKEAIHRYLIVVLNNLELNGHVKILDNRVAMYRQFFRNRGEINALLRHYSFEIVLDTVEACDKLAYYFIKKYQIEDANIQDNIRRPLPGGNQSLTLLYERDNDCIKVVIMTKKMQKAARLGVIGAEHASDVSQSVIQASLRNMKELVDEETLDENSPDFTAAVSTINELMDYLHSSKILCYSPQGRAYELPQGATALDFAYAVGPMVGNVAVGANIDNEKAKLGTVVKNGQLVEIEIDSDSEPKAEWLGFVVTNKARKEILRWFKDLPTSEKQRHGQQALDRALKTYHKSLADLYDSEWNNLLEWRGVDDKNVLFEQISSGTLLPQLVVSRLFSDEMSSLQADVSEASQPQQLIVNTAGVELDFANCCHPIYGDPIVGHLSRHGLVVHRHKCFSLDDIRKDNPYQIIQLQWRDDKAVKQNDSDDAGNKIRFPAYLKLSISLSDEQISEVVYHLRQLNIGVETIDVRHSDTIVHVVVRSRVHLAQGIRELRSLLGFPNIMRLYQL
ncbi:MULTISPECIES: RelA/SpoT family protein [unclassified Psychrobacter]|uniref:RelA/SpoT family protein n=1 Tax=unclassified Psychrobacter TaxID=196806 RepID=UPI0004192D17|nr:MULTISPECIES: HD domain-containing protein [unclassified Psychrobacter]